MTTPRTNPIHSGRCYHMTHFSAPLFVSWSQTRFMTSSCGFSCSCPLKFESKCFAGGAQCCSWDSCTATWMPVRGKGAVEVPLFSNAVRPIVGAIFCGLPWRWTSTVSTEQRQEPILVSYTSEDKKSDRERYIRVAAIDIAIIQGIWSIYYFVEMGDKSSLISHYWQIKTYNVQRRCNIEPRPNSVNIIHNRQ